MNEKRRHSLLFLGFLPLFFLGKRKGAEKKTRTLLMKKTISYLNNKMKELLRIIDVENISNEQIKMVSSILAPIL
ncbi:MAG: hypothetical protein WCP73_07940 [Eubacteriales bacterium]